MTYALRFEVWWKTKRLVWWTKKNQFKDDYLGARKWRTVGEPHSDFVEYTTPAGNPVTLRVVSAYLGRVKQLQRKRLRARMETSSGIIIPGDDLADIFRRYDGLVAARNELAECLGKLGFGKVRAVL